MSPKELSLRQPKQLKGPREPDPYSLAGLGLILCDLELTKSVTVSFKLLQDLNRHDDRNTTALWPARKAQKHDLSHHGAEAHALLADGDG